jgi:thiamine-phosphate pyrophosphorylase
LSLPALIAITDPRWTHDGLVWKAEQMLRAVARGAVAIQVRDKSGSSQAVLALAERLAAVCAEHGAPLYVNDRIDIALAVGAAGVHLGEASVDAHDARVLLGEHAFVSVAAHQPDDVARARAFGASAILASPIYTTPGKSTPLGPAMLERARTRAGGMGVYALGGVDASRAEACIAAGADGVAVIRALWEPNDTASAARALVEAVSAARREVTAQSPR